MIWIFALLVSSAGLIYFSYESFVNSIEWLDQKLRLTQTAIGTVLAAVGTALPESAVTLVAVAFSHRMAQKEIGIGTAISGPLALITVVYAVVGLALLANTQRLGRKRSPPIKADIHCCLQSINILPGLKVGDSYGTHPDIEPE